MPRSRSRCSQPRTEGPIGPGDLIETMGFESRDALAMFFESGASMRDRIATTG